MEGEGISMSDDDTSSSEHAGEPSRSELPNKEQSSGDPKKVEPPQGDLLNDQRKAEPPPADAKKDEQSLNIGFDTAVNFVREVESGAGSPGGAAASDAVKKVLGDAFRRKAPGRRERFLHHDPWTRYERGLARLEERIPPDHPEYTRIAIQRNKLQENIDSVRNGRDEPALYNERHSTIAVLDGLVIAVLRVTFMQLCEETPGAQADAVQDEEMAKPPETAREVSQWFLALNPMEQCFALAVTILDGAPSHKVSRAASDLYEPMRQEMLRREEQARRNQKKGYGSEPVAPAMVGIEQLLERTFTVTERFDGAERIRWRNDARIGRMREFLARQTTTVGMMIGDRNLLDILQEWAIRGEEERGWRAALTLAELWWRQDQRALLTLADEWAASHDMQTWQGAAALLYGAYAAEQAEDRLGREAGQSPILDHLVGWSDWREDHELACVAAYTYGLLGYRWPMVALDGLDRLLAFEFRAEGTSERSAPLDVLVFALMAYTEIAEAGYIRPLLARLASHAERLAHAARVASGGREKESQRRQREARLGMLFFLYVFFAAYSASAVNQGKHTRYVTEAKLAPKPAFPSDQGQDALLAGVLSSGEREWRQHVATLLCAALASGHHEMAVEVLKYWAVIALHEPGPEARAAMVRFAVVIGGQLRRWDSELHQEGMRSALALYQTQLRRWTLGAGPDQRALKGLAEDMMGALAR
jgi:hypothetical protein